MKCLSRQKVQVLREWVIVKMAEGLYEYEQSSWMMIYKYTYLQADLHFEITYIVYNFKDCWSASYMKKKAPSKKI